MKFYLDMTLEGFIERVKARMPLDTEEIQLFMNEMSDEARKITIDINNSYHSQEELRARGGRRVV